MNVISFSLQQGVHIRMGQLAVTCVSVPYHLSGLAVKTLCVHRHVMITAKEEVIVGVRHTTTIYCT